MLLDIKNAKKRQLGRKKLRSFYSKNLASLPVVDIRPNSRFKQLVYLALTAVLLLMLSYFLSKSHQEKRKHTSISSNVQAYLNRVELADTNSIAKNSFETKVLNLNNGDNLFSFLKAELPSGDLAQDVVFNLKDSIDLTLIRPTDLINIFYKEGEFKGISLNNDEKNVVLLLNNDSFELEEEYHETETKTFYAHQNVKNSIFADGIEAGIPNAALLEMTRLFSFDIDFQTDIQEGTEYELIYSIDYNEKNQYIGNAVILYANIDLQDGRSFPIFRYELLDGKYGYYSIKGISNVKTLMRTPINGAYISSGFGYRRAPKHSYTAFHRGVDFAAPKGTPIMAGGSGYITYRGWSTVGYGNLITIRHENGYETLYGHQSAFNRNYRVGSYVQQGSIIGYVGSTGYSTGPHLHYEIRKNGTAINPASIRFQSGKKLKGRDAELFNNTLMGLYSSFAGLLPLWDQHPLMQTDSLIASSNSSSTKFAS